MKRSGRSLTLLLCLVTLASLAACDRRQKEAAALADQGVVEGRAGDLAGALRRFDEALQRDPDNLKALYNSGLVLLASGRGDEAALRFRRFLEQRPEDALGHLQLARAVLWGDRRAEALDLLQRAVELGLDDYAAWLAATDLSSLSHELRFHQLEAVVAQRAGAPVDELRPGEGYVGKVLRGAPAPGVTAPAACE